MNTYYPLFALAFIILAMITVLVYTRSFRKHINIFKSKYPEIFKEVYKLRLMSATSNTLFMPSKIFFLGDQRMTDVQYEKSRKMSRTSLIAFFIFLILAFTFGSLSA